MKNPYFHLGWFDRLWWEYLLEKPRSWRAFFCRIKGHPCGPVWYSGTAEPNIHCKNCGDEIG